MLTSCHKLMLTVLMGATLSGAAVVYAGDAGIPELPGFSVAEEFSDAGVTPDNGGYAHQHNMEERLAGKLNMSVTDTMHLGVQSYTRLDGGKRYGLGLRKQLDETEVNLMLTSSGMILNTNTEGFGMGVSLEQHAPGDSEGSAYVGFGISKQW